jgi:hypothetical protein
VVCTGSTAHRRTLYIFNGAGGTRIQGTIVEANTLLIELDVHFFSRIRRAFLFHRCPPRDIRTKISGLSTTLDKFNTGSLIIGSGRSRVRGPVTCDSLENDFRSTITANSALITKTCTQARKECTDTLTAAKKSLTTDKQTCLTNVGCKCSARSYKGANKSCNDVFKAGKKIAQTVAKQSRRQTPQQRATAYETSRHLHKQTFRLALIRKYDTPSSPALFVDPSQPPTQRIYKPRLARTCPRAAFHCRKLP